MAMHLLSIFAALTVFDSFAYLSQEDAFRIWSMWEHQHNFIEKRGGISDFMSKLVLLLSFLTQLSSIILLTPIRQALLTPASLLHCGTPPYVSHSQPRRCVHAGSHTKHDQTCHERVMEDTATHLSNERATLHHALQCQPQEGHLLRGPCLR